MLKTPTSETPAMIAACASDSFSSAFGFFCVGTSAGLQRTRADKIPGLGECPPEDLKIEEEWGPQVLNMRIFFFSFKSPRHPNDL